MCCPCHPHPLPLQHAANKGKTSKQQAHVIIKYAVPPRKQQAFLDASERCCCCCCCYAAADAATAAAAGHVLAQYTTTVLAPKTI
jgi:hypothetical protein